MLGPLISVEEHDAKRDAVLKLKQARLQATFDSEDDPQVTYHTFRNAIEPTTTREEQWERQKSLGCGGFGTVYLEKCTGVTGHVEHDDDDKMGELRAVKRIQKAKNQSSLSKTSVRELNSLICFSGPAVSLAPMLLDRRNSLILKQYEYHFVKSFGWYESLSTLFIAMEYCPLGDMQSFLLDHGPVFETEAKYISGQMFRGIEFMHANNFIHGDMKPANLLVKSRPPTGEWWVKISDFGISRDIKESGSLSNTVCGTLGFMAPEMLGFDAGGQQLSRLAKGKAADLWAAGETIFRILTGKASFNDDFRLLMLYTMSQTRFPRGALLKAGTSADGVTFIEQCMAPKPSSRPSATYALETLRWPFSVPNAYEGFEVQAINTLRCKGKDEPFILSTPDMNELVVITSHNIYLWDMRSRKVARALKSNRGQDQPWEFSQASVSPDGRLLCVTQADCRRPPLLFNVRTLEFVCEIQDRLENSGQGVKISTFSPDGKYLVTACNDLLSQIETSSWECFDRYLGSLTPAYDASAAKNIKSMAFTTDGNRLVAAYENMAVIKDTSSSHWENIQVIEYPSSANAVAVSPGGTRVACGTDKGEIWLWTSEKNCWMRRMSPLGGDHSLCTPIDNITFTGTGNSITYTVRGGSTVSLVRTVPLNQRDFAMKFAEFHGQSIGRTVVCSGRRCGATALGGAAGARVVIWRYNT
jgi:serine/threonine protein kinase